MLVHQRVTLDLLHGALGISIISHQEQPTFENVSMWHRFVSPGHWNSGDFAENWGSGWELHSWRLSWNRGVAGGINMVFLRGTVYMRFFPCTLSLHSVFQCNMAWAMAALTSKDGRWLVPSCFRVMSWKLLGICHEYVMLHDFLDIYIYIFWQQILANQGCAITLASSGRGKGGLVVTIFTYAEVVRRANGDMAALWSFRGLKFGKAVLTPTEQLVRGFVSNPQKIQKGLFNSLQGLKF